MLRIAWITGARPAAKSSAAAFVHYGQLGPLHEDFVGFSHLAPAESLRLVRILIRSLNPQE
jgi:hypothetical protein